MNRKSFLAALGAVAIAPRGYAQAQELSPPLTSEPPPAIQTKLRALIAIVTARNQSINEVRHYLEDWRDQARALSGSPTVGLDAAVTVPPGTFSDYYKINYKDEKFTVLDAVVLTRDDDLMEMVSALRGEYGAHLSSRTLSALDRRLKTDKRLRTETFGCTDAMGADSANEICDPKVLQGLKEAYRTLLDELSPGRGAGL